MSPPAFEELSPHTQLHAALLAANLPPQAELIGRPVQLTVGSGHNTLVLVTSVRAVQLGGTLRLRLFLDHQELNGARFSFLLHEKDDQWTLASGPISGHVTLRVL